MTRFSAVNCQLFKTLLSSIEMGVARLELAHPLRTTDFKSVASTIPPHPQAKLAYLFLDNLKCVADR
jgi:hypothetical protein